MITLRPIQIHTPEYALFIKICEESFPAFERDVPQSFFVKPSNFRNDPCGIFRDEQMVGYLMAWHGQDFSYILEFAVAAEWRGQGIGGQSLQLIKERCAPRCVTLCCEKPDPDADNAVQRQRRYEMYCRNGFLNTGSTIRMYGIDFAVMSSKRKLPEAEFALMNSELDRVFPTR